MKNRVLMLFFLLAISVMVVAGTLSLQRAQAQISTADLTAKQLALEKTVPQLQVTEEVLPLMIPGHTLGETEGVEKTKNGHLFEYGRTGWAGSSKGGTAARGFEFDENNKFIKEWLPDMYGASFAHSVRQDAQGNMWFVDEGSNMIIKVNPEGRVLMVLGRKEEAIDYMERFIERGEKLTPEQVHPAGSSYTFGRPTDVAFDAQGNIFVADGYKNSRWTKQDKNGVWVGAGPGSYGNGPEQYSVVHTISANADTVFVGDRGNWRIKVFEAATMKPKGVWTGMGMPWGTCITHSKPEYLMSGDGTGKLYKMDMTGKLLGWVQVRANRGQTGCLIHEISCDPNNPNIVYSGSCSQWDIEKITIK